VPHHRPLRPRHRLASLVARVQLPGCPLRQRFEAVLRHRRRHLVLVYANRPINKSINYNNNYFKLLQLQLQ